MPSRPAEELPPLGRYSTEPPASRHDVLEHRIHRATLTDPDVARRYHTDPGTHAQITVLRQVLQAADQAMRAEGVSEAVRDRVVHRVLFGEAPPSLEDDPEVRIDWADAHQRHEKLVRDVRRSGPLSLPEAVQKLIPEGPQQA